MWCDAATQTVYTEADAPTSGTFQCDPSGQPNSIACISISPCAQSGAGYYATTTVRIQTVSYVGSGPGCTGYPFANNCVTVKPVTSTLLLPLLGTPTATHLLPPLEYQSRTTGATMVGTQTARTLSYKPSTPPSTTSARSGSGWTISFHRFSRAVVCLYLVLGLYGIQCN